MKNNLSLIIRSAQLTAERSFVALVLLCAAGVRAAEPTFTNVTATLAPGLPQLWVESVTWVDYDNDGRLDLFITTSDDARSQLWRNTGSGFTNVTAEVGDYWPGGGLVAWADYDNDGLLDLLMTGYPQP